MDRAPHHHVYKYYEPADRFVRVRVLDGTERETLLVRLGSDLSGPSYRRAVAARCIEEFEAAQGGLEALYRLAIEVNPELDIRSIRLRAAPRERRAPERAREPGKDFRPRLRRLARACETRLAGRIVGQTRAVATVAAAVRRAAVDWERRGPLASLLFVGPTGTGKTELARALAEELGGKERLLRVDCSEFAEGHEYAKLIGAPPGYVGHGDGGFLGRALAKTPEAVVLFDEVEKAHPRLHHLLLQVLDEGHLTDGRGVRLDLRSCFVVLTSNTGTRELAEGTRRLGFERKGLDGAARREVVERSLARAFRPEFLARLDEIVLFDELSAADAFAIARQQLARLAVRVRTSGARVEFTAPVARWVAERGLSVERGAREVEQVIRREIEAPLAEAMLADGRERGWWRVSVRGGRLLVARAA